MVTAIILAGGLGTRLRSVVSDVPKPMAPINGRPFLEYQFDYWIRQGVTRFIISVGYKHEVIVDYFGTQYKEVQLDYVIEHTPLGTGGGLLLAAEKLSDDSFLLLNGDTFFAVNLESLIQFSKQNNADWCLSVFSTDNSKGRYLGIDVSPDGSIQSLQLEKKENRALINGGVYWVQKRALPSHYMPEANISLEDSILPNALIANQNLFAKEFSGKFIDIGVPNDYHRSASLLI